MTTNEISGTHEDVSRKKTNFEQMVARFPAGTFARVDSVLTPEERRADFVRVALEAEIKRRQLRLQRKRRAEE